MTETDTTITVTPTDRGGARYDQTDQTDQPSVGRQALLEAMTGGRPIQAEGVAPDAWLDATVPNWRLTERGRDRVIARLAEFYAHPGQFEQVDHWAIPGGEVVEVTLAWTEDGVPHLVHQCHRLDLDDQGRIAGDTMWCGGRWPADLMAQMEEADEHG